MKKCFKKGITAVMISAMLMSTCTVSYAAETEMSDVSGIAVMESQAVA